MHGAGCPIVGDLVYEESLGKTQEGAVNQEEGKAADDPGSESFDDHLVILCLPFSR